MISNVEIIFIVAAIFFLDVEPSFCMCAQAEYEIHGQCCPMCIPGTSVYRHCTEDTSTTCAPCIGLTYTDEPHGLEKCSICSVCDSGSGLRIKVKCTRSSDTVCEPLEGHYCIDQVRNSCTHAVEHKTCSPGQHIKHKGTAFKDTICDSCTAGTYSNGSLQTCQPHSKCEDLGLVEIKPGTSSTDVECTKKLPVAVIAGIITSVVVIAAAVGVSIFLKYRLMGRCSFPE